MKLSSQTIMLFISLYSVSVWAEPIIKVDQDRIDFGKYPANQAKEHTFTITNAGDQPLKILKIRKTCGCSETRLDKEDLNPGESAKLTAVIKPESIAGPYSKTLFIHNTDPKQSFLMLTLNGQSTPLVEIKPQNRLYAGTIPAGTQWQQEFLMETTVPEISFAKEEVSGPALTKLEKQPDGKFKLTVTLNPVATTPQINCRIKIPVKFPSDWQPLEITIMAQVR